MPDYLKTVLYIIYCKDETIHDIYVGHTTNFTKRKSNHHTKYKQPEKKHYNMPVYQFMRDNGGFDNWNIEMVFPVPCNNVKQARKHERKLIEVLGATLNHDIPGRLHKEYEDTEREKIRTRGKEYYSSEKGIKKRADWTDKNKDNILEKKKLYYQANRDDIKEKVKNYAYNNKELVSLNNKIYRIENFDKIKARRQELRNIKGHW